MRIAAASILVALSTVAMAQENTRVYLNPDDSFTAYFTSALQKKNVPVTVTTDVQRADYTVTFQAKNSDGSLIQGITSAINNGAYNSGAFNEVSMTVIDDKTKDVVYGYTCKKYNQYSGQDSRMATSVAECLAKHWKDKLRK